jgi:putative salt-induced outer membrane protein
MGYCQSERGEAIIAERSRMRNHAFFFGVICVVILAISGRRGWAQTVYPETNTWHGDIALGLSLTKGNANTLLFSGSAAADREWLNNELHFGVNGQYGLNNFDRTNETKTASNIQGFGEYRRLITERFYASLRADGLHDDIAEVHYRLIVGPAIGYYFIRTDDTRVSGEVGPSFIEERLGEGKDHGYLALRLSERAEHSFNKSAKIWEQVDWLPHVNNLNNYLVNAEAGAEAAFNSRLSLRIVGTDRYNTNPAPGLKKNDITLISSLVWKY